MKIDEIQWFPKTQIKHCKRWCKQICQKHLPCNMIIKKEFFYLLHTKELWVLLYRQILKDLKLNIPFILIQSLIEMALDFIFSIYGPKVKHPQQ